MKRLLFAVGFLVCSVGNVHPGELPAVRAETQFNQETGVWVKTIESVRISGKAVSLFNDKSDGAKAAIQDLLGPYLPPNRLEYVWVQPNGTFGLKFKKKYRVDIPLKAGGYIRVNLWDKEILGELMGASTFTKKIPIKLLVFRDPHALQIDKLGENRKSTVSGIGKLLGLLPHIVALAFVEVEGVPYAAPQLDGLGASENNQIALDMLHLDDTLLPEKFLANPHKP